MAWIDTTLLYVTLLYFTSSAEILTSHFRIVIISVSFLPLSQIFSSIIIKRNEEEEEILKYNSLILFSFLRQVHNPFQNGPSTE
jgi:hypothetical protein